MSKKIHIRFYEELNDFLPKKKHKIRFEHTYNGKPSIKDIIESMGVPHTEIDLILVNGKSVGFNYYPENRDDISVYPVFENIDIQELNHLRPKSLRETRFVLDVHLGKLARYLRLTGFDTLYNNSFEDREIVEISKDQKRIILTCDVGILKYNDVTHGLWIRERRPKEQLK